MRGLWVAFAPAVTPMLAIEETTADVICDVADFTIYLETRFHLWSRSCEGLRVGGYDNMTHYENPENLDKVCEASQARCEREHSLAPVHNKLTEKTHR